MIDTVSQDKAGGAVKECGGCGKKIHDRYLLQALDMYWHEDCLKCSCCDCRLGEVGNSLYTKGNVILCKRDYMRLFGSTGYCSACSKLIPAFEMVMRARTNVYHLECFACQQCGHRFCVGDQFYLHDNMVLCGKDYEQNVLLARMGQQQQQQLPPLVPSNSSANGVPAPPPGGGGGGMMGAGGREPGGRGPLDGNQNMLAKFGSGPKLDHPHHHHPHHHGGGLPAMVKIANG